MALFRVSLPPPVCFQASLLQKQASRHYIPMSALFLQKRISRSTAQHAPNVEPRLAGHKGCQTQGHLQTIWLVRMRGRQLLADHFTTCAEALQCATSACTGSDGLPRGLVLQDNAVTLKVPATDGRYVEVVLNFLSPEGYPENCAVLVACESDAGLSSSLQEVSSFYEDRGTLHEVLGHVCREVNAGELF